MGSLTLGDDGAARFRTAQAAPGARRQTLSSAALPADRELSRVDGGERRAHRAEELPALVRPQAPP